MTKTAVKSSTLIPKTLHFIWVGDESKRPDNCIETWAKLNPGYQIKIWGNASLVEHKWINAKHMDAMLDRELNGVADMMRWEILHHEGGIVLDADSVCLRALDDELLDCEAFACWESEIARPGLIAAGYFGCKAGNPFVQQIIQDIKAEPSVTHEMAWKTVGPLRLTESYRRYQYFDLRILPSHYFIPDHFSGISYKGPGPVYANQLWGSTRHAYDAIHEQRFDAKGRAIVKAPAAKAKAPIAKAPAAKTPVAIAPVVVPAVEAKAPAATTCKFHRIWFGKNPIPASYERYWQAWQRQFPECEFVTWTDADIEKLDLTKARLATMSSAVSRADLARYEILHTFGGIYLDCDIMPHAHFDVADLTRELTVCNETESREYCSIGFIGAPAGHPIFKGLIDHILSSEIDETRPNHATGPWLFGAHLTRHPHKRLPVRAFYPYLYDEPFSTLRTRNLEGTLGIHVWGGAWLPPDLKKNKALQLLGKGDLVDAATIIDGFKDQWADDVRLLLGTIQDVRMKSAEIALVLNQNLNVSEDCRGMFEFGKVVHWLLEQDTNQMVWQIGAADGVLVDPLRPAMVNFDPPAMLLEPNPYMFRLLQQGYRNNKNAKPVNVAYGMGDTELVLNAVNPEKVAKLNLPRWVLGLSSFYDDKNALGGLTIDEATTRLIQSCVEKIAVPMTGYDALVELSGGRTPDILVIDAEGMDKPIIEDIIGKGARPQVIHFEIQCLGDEDRRALIGLLAKDYALVEFGNDVTAYRIDVVLAYAKAIYIQNGQPTLFGSSLRQLNGLAA